MYPMLVADIGGTHARYSLVTGCCQDRGEYTLTEQKVFTCASFGSFEDSLHAYLANIKGAPPKTACLAIAGPVENEPLRMTNLAWTLSRDEITRGFKLQHIEVINDFAAQACAVPYLAADKLRLIKPGRAIPEATRAIIGPGTGLGVASLVRAPQGWLPVSGEGGHVSFAPGDQLELDLLRILWREHHHVSRETLLCGPGLVTLYRALAELHGQTPDTDSPVDISARASSDPLCRQTLAVFCAALGSAAGDVALTCGARGGVYLTGGILPRIGHWLGESAFVDRFAAKGVMSGYMADIPVHLVLHEQPALIGAAAWLEYQLSR